MEMRLKLGPDGTDRPKRGLYTLLDFVYPPLCYYCQGRVVPDTILCGSCINDMEIAEPYELAQDLEHITKERLLTEIVVRYIFDKFGPLRRLHQYLKYENRPYIGILLGEDLARAIPPHWIHSENRIVIPVPIHRLRLLERGYNQSEYIARGLASVSRLPLHCDVVKRIGNSRTQIGLSIEDRQTNLANVFRVVNTGKLENKDIVIVDDVITTGATATQLASTLLECGARSVSVAAIGFTRPG